MKNIVRDTTTAGMLACMALASAACQPTSTNTMSTNTAASTNMAEPSGSTDVPMVANASNAMGSAPAMTEEERRAYMTRHGMGFGAIDTNSDGRVTMEEANAYARVPLTSGGDSDNDGAMSAAELARTAPEVRTVLLQRDADGDGAVSSAEIDARVETRFRMADANRDGGVTEQELQAATAAAPPR